MQLPRIFPNFSHHFHYLVDDGIKIHFWEDVRWGDQTFRLTSPNLQTHLPNLYLILQPKDSPFSSILDQSSSSISWKFNCHHNLTDQEIYGIWCLCLYHLPFLLFGEEGYNNSMLQLRRLGKALSVNWCVIFTWTDESVDPFLIHCHIGALALSVGIH